MTDQPQAHGGHPPAEKDQIHAWVPEMERDVTGLQMIEKLSKSMFD